MSLFSSIRSPAFGLEVTVPCSSENANRGLRPCTTLLEAPDSSSPNTISKKSIINLVKMEFQSTVNDMYSGKLKTKDQILNFPTPVCNPFASTAIPAVFNSSRVEVETNHLGQACGSWPAFSNAEISFKEETALLNSILSADDTTPSKQRFLKLYEATCDPKDPLFDPKMKSYTSFKEAAQTILSNQSSIKPVPLSPGEEALLKKFMEYAEQKGLNKSGVTCAISRKEAISQREVAYLNGSKVHAFNCFYQKVIGELKRTKKLKITLGRQNPCWETAEKYLKFEKSTTGEIKDMSATVLSQTLIDDIENCQESGTTEAVVNSCHLYSMRERLESAFARLVVCEINARAARSEDRFFQDFVTNHLAERVMSSDPAVSQLTSSQNLRSLAEAKICSSSQRSDCDPTIVLNQCYKKYLPSLTVAIAAEHWNAQVCGP